MSQNLLQQLPSSNNCNLGLDLPLEQIFLHKDHFEVVAKGLLVAYQSLEKAFKQSRILQNTYVHLHPVFLFLTRNALNSVQIAVEQVRKRDCLFSLIDVAKLVTTRDANAAKHQLSAIAADYPEVGKTITHLKFAATGRQAATVTIDAPWCLWSEDNDAV